MDNGPNVVHKSSSRNLAHVNTRLDQINSVAKYKTQGLKPSFDEKTKIVLVRVGSGWKMTSLIQKSLKKNLTGLEWFAGIPGSLGGAIYMNMHGGNYFWSDFVEEVRVLDKTGKPKTYSNTQLKFGYDKSILHQTREIIIDAVIRLYRGDE